ncbi:MFS transporter [Polaromonas sp. C04]|uniref:MFS transporter n=1 Tax=Polaromonas sp. C04 TaxID=1945857 RepID=UPI00098744FF|nr:MFS transporter [Polaromonas sp. C04]OOG53222.1 MFS transporter [Polaromonas sp. C04]
MASVTARTSAPSRARPWRILPVIVLAQFAATSLWFAGNAVLTDLQTLWNLQPASLGLITSAVQIGFVAGTLFFAILAVSDRFSAASVFLCCSILGALCNLSILLVGQGLWSLVLLRLLTGFFLAGIYPVGMKIAASWCERGLGRALGYLVGALVLGTAFPHLLRGLGTTFEWGTVLASVSAFAVLGGIAIYLMVPAGPYLPAKSSFDVRAIPRIFASPDLRAAAWGYFGHMWELYALWAFTPSILRRYADRFGLDGLNVSLWSFYVIAAGAIGCIAGGLIASRAGSARVASAQLGASGVACLLSPLMFHASPLVFFAFMLFWGVTVAGDSPQFSTLIANAAPREYVGSALTVVNCIGFAITAVSIQLISDLSQAVNADFLFLVLAPGPLIGLLASRRLMKPAMSRHNRPY